MSTPDSFLNSGTQNYATAGNWSAGVPNINNDAKIELAAKTTVNMSSTEGVNSISIGSNDDLEINDTIFDVANGASAVNGVINVNNGSTLNFKGAGVENAGDLNLNSTGSTTKIELTPSPDNTTNNTTIAGGGAGTLSTIALGGLGGTGDVFDDEIVSDGADNVALTLVNETLQGAGTVGDSHFTLDVAAGGVVDADISILAANTAPLVLTTGTHTIMNAGTLETTNSSELVIDSPVDNTGTILSSGQGNLVLNAPVTGSGAIDIGADSVLDIEGAGSVSGNVNFTGGGAQLFLVPGVIQGDVTGMLASDSILMGGFLPAERSGSHAVWQQTSSTGGTLSIYQNGVGLANVNIAGQFNSLDFVLAGFGRNEEIINARSTPVYAENPGNNDEWILSDGNWIESAGPGSHPSGYNVALTGDWTGNINGTDGILWFNPTTGDADEWQLSNTQWSASADLGTHPGNATDGASYQIAGTDGSTDFTDNRIDDVLWTSDNSDGTVATDIWELGSDGKWAGSVSPGNHPAGYTVAGTGDWTGSGTDGILWFNSSTSDTDEWQLSGGQWAASVDLGIHPTNATDGNSYQIAGVGDFFDNGRDGVLWTSVNSDGTVATDIWELNSSGQWMASTSPGNHPAGYSVVGIGDFTGTGTSDILWYNASNGATDEWLINNGQWAGSVDLGTHPGGFQIAGVGDFNGDGTKDILWHSPS